MNYTINIIDKNLDDRFNKLKDKYNSCLKGYSKISEWGIDQDTTLLFLHLGNPEGDTKIDGVRRFAKVAKSVLDNGGRVVFHTGGGRKDTYNDCKYFLESNSYIEGTHFIKATIDRIENELLPLPDNITSTSNVEDLFGIYEPNSLLKSIYILV